jgi:hypothetical protein
MSNVGVCAQSSAARRALMAFNRWSAPPQFVLVTAYEQPLRKSVHPLRLQQERPDHHCSGRRHLPGGNRNGLLCIRGRALLVRFVVDQRYCPSGLPRRTIS